MQALQAGCILHCSEKTVRDRILYSWVMHVRIFAHSCGSVSDLYDARRVGLRWRSKACNLVDLSTSTEMHPLHCRALQASAFESATVRIELLFLLFTHRGHYWLVQGYIFTEHSRKKVYFSSYSDLGNRWKGMFLLYGRWEMMTVEVHNRSTN